jgi:hypothetical protein
MATKTEFPERARPFDPTHGYLTVQRNLDLLRDAFDTEANTIIRGTSTVLSGTTTIIAVHGLNKALYSVALTPLADPGARVWVSNKTGSQFQINISAAPGINVPFDWIVKGD